MIASGAQVRAARGFLGWSQNDLAERAGLHVNVIRKWEASHGERQEMHRLESYSAARIGRALINAGITLHYEPVGVSLNEALQPREREPRPPPPIYRRWQEHRKPDSKAGQERKPQAQFARMITQRPMTLDQGVSWYRTFRRHGL